MTNMLLPDRHLANDDSRTSEATEKAEAPKSADYSSKALSPMVEEPITTGNKDEEPTTIGKEDGDAIHYLKGLRFRLIMTALCVCLFLTNLEIPIVTTSLVGITKELHGFDQSSWIISAYLLGYVGVLIIFAKLSDIFGRKSLLLTALFIFLVFSSACGAAQTMPQLITFRAFQGVGGAGNYAISTVMFAELVPPEQYAATMSAVSVVYSISLLLGPIIGGAINQSSTWRWVFLLNIPPCVVTGIIIIIYVPNGFPRQHLKGSQTTTSRKFSKTTLGRLDLLGTAMLLVATIFFVAALENAGSRYPWKSAFVISLLVISGVLWIAFLAWERKVTLAAKAREPVFPWRFVQSRIWVGLLLNALFLGPPWFVAIFQLPQKFQFVNGVSPLGAGIRLMPFTFAAPWGSMSSAIIAGKFKVPPIYLVIFASILQVIGFVLLSTVPASAKLVPAQYGYEVIAGFGCGINVSTLILMTPFSVQKRDNATALGAAIQFRIMGGAVGLAVVTTVFNSHVRPTLAGFLSREQAEALLKSADAVKMLAPETQEIVKNAFASGYNLQMKILAGFAAAQIPSSILMWQKKQILV